MTNPLEDDSRWTVMGDLAPGERNGNPRFSDFEELLGDDVPYHLRLDAPPLGQCNRCGRQTWAESELGAEDRMTQPDGNPCGGLIVAVGVSPRYGKKP